MNPIIEIMEPLENYQKKFENRKNAYAEIKEQANKSVDHWVWASGAIDHPEPYYFEQRRFKKVRKLKSEPQSKANKYRYGLNATEQIIIEEQYTSLKDRFYETFYIYNGEILETYRFDYAPEKSLINIHTYIFQNKKLQESIQIVNNGWTTNTYNYNGNLLETKRVKNRDPRTQKMLDRKFEYLHDKFGVLSRIIENDYIWYQKPDRDLTFKQLSEIVKKRLTETIKAMLSKQNLEDTFCLLLGYGNENIFPPTITFCKNADKNKWVNEKGIDAKDFLWNPAEYEQQLLPKLDKETINLFDLYNQEISLQNKEKEAVETLLFIASEVKKYVSQNNLSPQTSFVVVPTDYENTDLKRIFKKINPMEIEIYLSNKLL